jgi:hypothetical protein
MNAVRTLDASSSAPPKECEVCGETATRYGQIVVEHCHRCQRIRGYACPACNGKIGWVDNLKMNRELFLKVLEFSRRCGCPDPMSDYLDSIYAELERVRAWESDLKLLESGQVKELLERYPKDGADIGAFAFEHAFLKAVLREFFKERDATRVPSE